MSQSNLKAVQKPTPVAKPLVDAKPVPTTTETTDQGLFSPSVTEKSLVDAFNSLLGEYATLGLSRREVLHKAILQSVCYNYRFNKVILIQKVLKMLLEEGSESGATFKRALSYYQNVAGFKINVVGKDIQIKRSKATEFSYDATHLVSCRKEENKYYNLAQSEVPKPYQPKDLDTLRKSFASTAALAILADGYTIEDIQAVISGLQSAAIIALKDPKIIAKAEKAKALQNAPVEIYDAE